MTTVIAIACIEQETRAIGKEDGSLLYSIQEDMRRFVSLTKGHPIIVGRKTFETFPKKPLPNRTNIVVTRNKDFECEGCPIYTHPRNALEAARAIDQEKVYVVGGGEIYTHLLPYTDELQLTVVRDLGFNETKTHIRFPEFYHSFVQTEISEWKRVCKDFDYIQYRYEHFRRVL